MTVSNCHLKEASIEQAITIGLEIAKRPRVCRFSEPLMGEGDGAFGAICRWKTSLLLALYAFSSRCKA
jgi:hypothetical protein